MGEGCRVGFVCVWVGGVDEYSQAVSGVIVVNHLFFFSFWALSTAGSHDGPSCAAHLLGSVVQWLVQYG